jgi:uncharacterized protein with HEPN domain
MKKDPRVYLARILGCADRIEQYIGQDREVFLHNTMVQDAVIRNFEVIGEAAKRITKQNGRNQRRRYSAPLQRQALSRKLLARATSEFFCTRNTLAS